ncbi:hypothetical protein DID88_009935 [Monilinia fructigena]|uniref:Uncharacterized protein n=1 Tax=Monilinia fructigena TaxID=38457 RepID=A0A395IK00_9HELO|nr:hypothetical protein DID88_009935 [Monilinia fructigena]
MSESSTNHLTINSSNDDVSIKLEPPQMDQYHLNHSSIIRIIKKKGIIRTIEFPKKRQRSSSTPPNLHS